MPALRPAQTLLLALLLLPLAACDETGGMSADVEAAVQDALIARERGDYTRAVEILEDAHDREPANPVVRVELATTILERDGVNFLDVDRIAGFLADGTDATARTVSAARSGAACAYASDPSAASFAPSGLDGFTDLVAEAASIDRATELLATVIPDAIGSFSVCENVIDGELSYDRDGAIAALRTQGLSETQVRQVLAVNALASIVDAYLFVSTEIVQDITWYRLADGSIAICADDPEALQAEAEAAIAHFGEAVLSLDARASLLSADSASSDLVDLAADAFEELRDAFGATCAD